MSSSPSSAALPEEIIVLFHAALIGRTDVIQNALASLKASGKVQEEDGLVRIISTQRPEDEATPLHVAVHFGHVDVVRALLNAGADLTIIPEIGEFLGKRPYELASENIKSTFHVYFFEQTAMGNVTAIVRLVEGGIPVDVKDGSHLGDSALHWACSFANVDVAIALLSHGCDVNILNAEKQSPLHAACKGKFFQLVELLLLEGADVTALDSKGLTPLDILKQSGGHTEIEKLIANPPAPTFKLKNEFLAKQEAAAKAIADKEAAIAAATVPSLSPIGEDEADSEKPTHMMGTDENVQPPYIFHDGEDSEGEESTGDAAGAAAANTQSTKLLVFWPPVKVQSRPPLRSRHLHGPGLMNSTGTAPPMLLSSSENLLICVASNEIDIFPLLTWSGLMDTMDLFGFQVQVKRSSLGAKVRLCIDSHICPRRHSYELQVRSDQILIMASDTTGLLYGVYTFIQLLQLHSEVHTISASTNVTPAAGNNSSSKSGSGVKHASGGSAAGGAGIMSAPADDGVVVTVSVPAINISDWPDVANRAVLWSYRLGARTAPTRMRDHIELLSKLRINQLYLLVDSTAGDAAAVVDDVAPSATPQKEKDSLQQNSPRGPSTPSNSMMRKVREAVGGDSDDEDDFARNFDGIGEEGGVAHNRGAIRPDNATTKIYALDEICKKHNVEMAPTVIIKSIHESLPFDVLRNFSHPVIAVLLLFEESVVREELQQLLDAAKELHNQSLQHSSANSKDTSNPYGSPDRPSNKRNNVSLAAPGSPSHPSHPHHGLAALAEGGTVTSAMIRRACQHAVMKIVKEVQSLGFTSLMFSCTPWTKKVADPMVLASKAGINAVERDISLFYPSSLFYKPLVCNLSFVNNLHTYSCKVQDSGSTMGMFPAFMDSAFFYPVIMTKFYCFLYAGFMWNKHSTIDMLGFPTLTSLHHIGDSPSESQQNHSSDRSSSNIALDAIAAASALSTAQDSNTTRAVITSVYDISIIKEVMTLLLFAAKAEISKNSFSTVMGLLTGDLVRSELTHHISAVNTDPENIESNGAVNEEGPMASRTETATATASSGGGGNGANESEKAHSTKRRKVHELAHAEHLLFSLLTLTDSAALSALPSKEDAAICLKLYRRMLTTAHWKLSSQTAYSSIMGSNPSTGLFSGALRGAVNGGLFGFGSAGGGSRARDVHSGSTGNSMKSDLNSVNILQANNSRYDDDDRNCKGGLTVMQLETEELFSVIHMQSVLCRAIVLSYNTTKKSDSSTTTSKIGGDEMHSYQQMFDALPAGTKSDLANSILESLNNCSYLWRHRFDRKLLDTLRACEHFYGPHFSAQVNAASANSASSSNGAVAEQQSTDNSSSSANNSSSAMSVRMSSPSPSLVRRSLHEANQRFMMLDIPTVPGGMIFKSITQKLPLPQSVEEFIQRLFVR